MWTLLCHSICASQRATCRSQIFSSILVPRLKLRSSSLAVSTSTHWALLPVPAGSFSIGGDFHYRFFLGGGKGDQGECWGVQVAQRQCACLACERTWGWHSALKIQKTTATTTTTTTKTPIETKWRPRKSINFPEGILSILSKVLVYLTVPSLLSGHMRLSLRHWPQTLPLQVPRSVTFKYVSPEFHICSWWVTTPCPVDLKDPAVQMRYSFVFKWCDFTTQTS